MKVFRLATFILGLMCILAWCGHTTAGKAQDKKEGKSRYEAAQKESDATKTVKLTVTNNSGKDVLLVSWRYWGPDYYYAKHLKADDKPVEVPNFAAEWRIVGVWEDGKVPPTSQPGWAASHNFDKDTTISINKDTLDIK